MNYEIRNKNCERQGALARCELALAAAGVFTCPVLRVSFAGHRKTYAAVCKVNVEQWAEARCLGRESHCRVRLRI
jgi:hypothetical protein